MSLTKKEKEEIIKEIKTELEKDKIIYVETCRDDITLPTYTHLGDAGMDLRAAEEVLLLPGETKIIPTGLKIVIPEGYELQIRPRSGLSLNTPLRIPNSPSTIDSGYREEIGIIMTNTSLTNKKTIYTVEEKGNKEGVYQIKQGDRIAQMILSKYEKITFKPVKSNTIQNIGCNRHGGIGHSGVK